MSIIIAFFCGLCFALLADYIKTKTMKGEKIMTTLKQTPDITNNLILREINNTLADIAASLKIIVIHTASAADVSQDNFVTGFNKLVEERYLDAHLLGDNSLSYSFRGIKNNKETED